MSFINHIKNYRPGPAMLVSAAFIGPGTVTACTMAGANFGYALLWALFFATISTIILQNFASRVALITGDGLGEAIMNALPTGWPRIAAAILMLTALFIGNAAYEAGNISGAGLGVSALFSGEGSGYTTTAIGLLAIMLLAAGPLKWLERLLIMLVIIMSLSFLVALFFVRPDFSALFSGFIPSIPDGATLTAVALIGTTIVPYNLFLHAGTIQRKWRGAKHLTEMTVENSISIGLGGLVSMAIIATAATSIFSNGLLTGDTGITNALDMAVQIEPIYGEFAKYALGIGLLGAGLTSAITAPLATGYIVSELWLSDDLKTRQQRMRWAALIIAIIGTIVASIGYKPIEIILLAQVANGLLLPFIAFFLLWIVNNRNVMGDHVPSKLHMTAGWVVSLICLALGLRLILRAAGIMA